MQRKEGQGKLEAKAAYSTEEILKFKNDYTPRMANKRNDLNIAPKTFLPILNYFLYSKGIPAIPPLLINGNFVTIFLQKLMYLIIFLVSICTPINNRSSLPAFVYKTNAKITSFGEAQNCISLIIKTLDLNISTWI